MRYVFYFLIATNLVFFGWRQWSAPNAANSATQVPQRPATMTSSSLSPIELAATSSQESPPVVSDAVAEAASPTPAQAPENIATTVVTEPASTNTEVASESPTTQIGSSSAATCRLSPWTTDSKLLDTWQAALSGASTAIEQQDIAVDPSYLVMIAALSSKEATLDRLRQLKTLPIESAYIHKGEQEGGISLGLFSKLASAQARLALVQASGVNDALLLERKKTQTEQRLWARSEHWPEAMQSWSVSSCDRDGRSAAP